MIYKFFETENNTSVLFYFYLYQGQNNGLEAQYVLSNCILDWLVAPNIAYTRVQDESFASSREF